MECTHLLDNIQVNGDLVIENTSLDTKNFCCKACGVDKQNWLCLQCAEVNCGRYINGHAKLHAESVGHQLCISCDIFSVYCYKCDDFISNDTEERTIDKIRQKVMRICDKESNSNLGDDDKSANLEGSESLVTTDQGDDIAPAVGSESDCSLDLLNNSGHITQDNGSDCKSTKSSDELVRSLRSRSRKRSHSEDSSSVENSSIQPSRSKEKKHSLGNGKSQKEKKVVGLKNLGNTCFMNAVLQSLNNIQEFSCYFSQLPSLETKPNGRKVYHSRSYTRQDVSEVVMAEELRKVLINLKTGGAKAAISPECLFLVIWKVVPRFRGYQQQDAHEFLRYMLDRLHTELQQLQPSERACASIVTAVFGGTLQSEVRCLACGAESKKLDPFLDLSLDLPDARVALHECLASFVQVEELADTERYFCSSCKCKQKSTKQFRIRRLPNVLCLHLKRFRWHNYFRTKVDTNITFPLSALDMSRFVLHNVPDTRRAARGRQLYDLAAVIVHHGSGAGSGHYTAFAINEGQWFHFNDQTVRAADADAVATCKPYIMFYIRREPSLAVPNVS